MHSLSGWRMLPPAGAPLGLAAMRRGIAARDRSDGLPRLRAMLRERFDTEHVFPVSSGRAALSLLFSVLRKKSKEREQVLIPAYVSYSVPSAVVNAGCRIALYDIVPDSLTPDWDSLAAAMSERTLAVVICHQFGLPFDPSPARDLCRASGATLVDDAAQAMGAEISCKQAGCMGDAGIFSLSRGKPITAVDGGLLLTNDADLAGRLESAAATLPRAASTAKLLARALALMLLRRPELYRLPASLPWLKIGASLFEPDFPVAALSPFQAGLAGQGLRDLKGINAARREKAAQYLRALTSLPALRPVLPEPYAEPVYLRFPVLPGASDQTEPLRNILADSETKRLGISPGFPRSLDALPELAPHRVPRGRDVPGARYLADNLITLPTHDQVRPRDIAAVAACLGKSGPGRNAANKRAVS